MAKNKKTSKKPVNPQNADTTVSSVSKIKPVENKPKAKEKGNNKGKVQAFFKKAGVFLKDCKNEIKKIVWPTVPVTFKNMGIVLIVIIVIGLFVFGLDTAFISLLSKIMNVAS